MHSEILSSSEHGARGLHVEFRKRLHPEFRVLDWGCGRGSDVLHLRKMGIDAYGAEISQETIDRGKSLFDEMGIDHAATIKLISPQNRTGFADASFDMIMSYQVLEHVADLESVAAEISRLLRPGGLSVHLYPAHRGIIEGHLYMPFVHWLPKNKLRYYAIRACTLFGVEPHSGWTRIANAPGPARAQWYFNYSVSQTFYRPPRRVAQVFREAGLAPRFESHLHHRVCATPLRRIPGPILNWLVRTFAGCVFIASKNVAH
jgi:SAM-dependent methyltransferase